MGGSKFDISLGGKKRWETKKGREWGGGRGTVLPDTIQMYLGGEACFERGGQRKAKRGRGIKRIYRLVGTEAAKGEESP